MALVSFHRVGSVQLIRACFGCPSSLPQQVKHQQRHVYKPARPKIHYCERKIRLHCCSADSLTKFVKLPACYHQLVSWTAFSCRRDAGKETASESAVFKYYVACDGSASSHVIQLTSYMIERHTSILSSSGKQINECN